VPLRHSTGFDRVQMPPGAREPIRSRQRVRASVALPRQAGEAAIYGLHSWFMQAASGFLQGDSCKQRIAAGLAASSDT
jgi:hypothetical protein